MRTRTGRFTFCTNHSPVCNGSDVNERFAVSRCSLFLARLLSRYPIIEEHSLTFARWLLGPNLQIFSAYLTSASRTCDLETMEADQGEECSESDIAEFLRTLFVRLPGRKRNHAVKLLVSLLKQRYEEWDCGPRSANLKKFEKMREAFTLTEREIEYCIFQLLIAGWAHAYDFFSFQLDINEYRSRSYLMAALNLTAKELEEVLHGTLRKIGLIESSGMDITINSDALELFSSLNSGNVSGKLFAPLKAADLPLEHHMVGRKETEHVLGLLRKKPEGSSHILLYGPPGTGKTSYARAVAQQIRTPFYEVMRGDEKNASSTRRAAILACLNMTNMGRGSVIVVDEADNLLDTGFSWIRRGETQDKGWLNELLEMPGVRMIWITNNIFGIEESVLRRFTYSVPFKPFTRRQRITLWNTILERSGAKQRLSKSDVEHLAADYKVSAGAITQAVETAVHLGKKGKASFTQAVRLTLDSHRTLLNGGETVRNKDKIEEHYSLEGLNTEGNLEDLLTRLKAFDHHLRQKDTERSGNMSLLFYGPPGTGKSELARYLAHQLDRELMVRRASDLLNAYVGATEANIKHAFEEAEAEEAVLVIDEVDSFLFNRERAFHSWEISFTNEFLSQMERFEGILVCTTNLMTDLDHASIRRFNHKIKFNYLTPEGNAIFYKKLLAPLVNAPLVPTLIDELKMISSLGPGDFKIVRDRFAYQPSTSVTHADLLGTLRAEARVKKTYKGEKEIGF